MKTLVTGVSDGIGGAICSTLITSAEQNNEKLTLVTTSSGRKPLPESLLAQISAGGHRHLHLTADFANADALSSLADAALEFTQGMDTFISNAGGMASAPLETLSLENWDKMFAINTRPTFLLAQKFRAALAQSKGSIVAVASMSGLYPHPPHGGYSASKAALIMLCKQLAQEWAQYGIRTNAVAPGMIETGIVGALYTHKNIREQREAMVPLHRIGQPQEIANIVEFLASPKSSYVTGQVLLADGGLTETLLGTLPGIPK